MSYSLGSFAREPIAGITPIAEMVTAVRANGPRAASSEFDLAWPSTPERSLRHSGEWSNARQRLPFSAPTFGRRGFAVAGRLGSAASAHRRRDDRHGLHSGYRVLVASSASSDATLQRGDGDTGGVSSDAAQAPGSRPRGLATLSGSA